jgi:hypothetical protein
VFGVAGFAVLVGLALVLVGGCAVTAWAAMTGRPRAIRRALITTTIVWSVVALLAAPLAVVVPLPLCWLLLSIPALLLYAPLEHRRRIGATGAVLSGLGAWGFSLGVTIGPAASFFVLLTVIQALSALQYVLYGLLPCGRIAA